MVERRRLTNAVSVRKDEREVAPYAEGGPLSGVGETCLDISRTSTVPVTCTLYWAISAPQKPDAEQIIPVHFCGEKSRSSSPVNQDALLDKPLS